MNVRLNFFIQNFSRAGGSERAVSLVANELANRGYSVSILSICGDNTCFFPLNKNIKLFTLINKKEVDNRKSFLIVLHELKRFYSINKIDICIDVFASLSIYTLLLKKKFGIRNITWEHYNYLNNMGLNKWGRKLAIKYSDRIVTLTETDRMYYISNNIKMNSKKVVSIFNPTPYPFAIPGENKEKIVVSVGRLEKLKGYDQLIDIWSMICREHNDWRLQIIGEGEELEKLKEIIFTRNIINVEFPGKRNDIEKFYQKASIYVSTSHREGLPMTMIEAQSFGLPIVSYDFETGPKDIIHNEIDGFIIPQNSNRNTEMAGKINYLIDNTDILKQFSDNAKKSSERFNIKAISDSWKRLIEGVMKEKK